MKKYSEKSEYFYRLYSNIYKKSEITEKHTQYNELLQLIKKVDLYIF